MRQSTGAGEAGALVLAIQEFVANGRPRPWSAPPECCIAGADEQPWLRGSAWLVAFLCESLVRCETPASDFRLLWMRKRAGAFRPQLLLVPEQEADRGRRRLEGRSLTKQEGHTGTH
jgi:hypothetical protein